MNVYVLQVIETAYFQHYIYQEYGCVHNNCCMSHIASKFYPCDTINDAQWGAMQRNVVNPGCYRVLETKHTCGQPGEEKMPIMEDYYLV